MTLRHDRARHVVGARALLAAALNGGDVEEHPGPVASRRHGAERDDGGGGEQSSDGEAPSMVHAAESSDERPRARSRPGTRPT